MKPFQYMIIYRPTPNEEKNGKRAEIVKDVTTVLAKDQETAAKIAMRQIPETYDNCLEQVDVILRPF